MSYITTMGVSYGIIMAADRQITQTLNLSQMDIQPRNDKEEFIINAIKRSNENLYKQINSFHKPLTKSARKLFTLGDNIGINMGQEMYTRKNYPVELLVDNFCRTNTFDEPKEAANNLLEFLRGKDENLGTIMHLGGYNKTNEEFPMPEIYHIDVRKNEVGFFGNMGFIYSGANCYFEPFAKRLNTQQTILEYSLQDAICICGLAIDMSRKLGRYLDFYDAISDDIEMIAITQRGIQWIKEAELEYKQ